MTVAEARRRLGLSDEKLAERCGVSRRHLAELQKGANVTLLVMQKVMRALGITDLSLGEMEQLSAPKPQEDAAALEAATAQLEEAAALLLNAAATVKKGKAGTRKSKRKRRPPKPSRD